MGERNRMDPRAQFSKKLARWTAVFWFFYMTWLSVMMAITPESALYAVYMGAMATLVMLLNVWAYTKNSVYEKGALALLDKTRIELSLKGGNGKTVKNGAESDDASETEDDAEADGGDADG